MTLLSIYDETFDGTFHYMRLTSSKVKFAGVMVIMHILKIFWWKLIHVLINSSIKKKYKGKKNTYKESFFIRNIGNRIKKVLNI